MNQSFKTTGLLLGTALFAASSAFAQEAETESRQQTVMVTATPIRDSQQAAIEAKRDSTPKDWGCRGMPMRTRVEAICSKVSRSP